jgi:thioredoxin reductase
MNPNSEIFPDGTFVLKQPVRLPEILDMLIVGGGPAGTAAAFRAKERGLAALVIDFDDVMKRIRDYAKDKLILPDYGGGDQMPFPNGDGLISLLRFSPIDKDDLCQQWKNFYRDHNIPVQVGVELLGMQRRDDGVWQARAYNHHTKAEQTYLARHVLIAVGRGAAAFRYSRQRRRFGLSSCRSCAVYRRAGFNHRRRHFCRRSGDRGLACENQSQRFHRGLLVLPWRQIAQSFEGAGRGIF